VAAGHNFDKPGKGCRG